MEVDARTCGWIVARKGLAMSESTEILVGFDGSPDARAALDWAVREAVSRNLTLRVLYVEPDLSGWDAAAASMSGAPTLATTLPHDGSAILAEALEKAQAAGCTAATTSVSGPTAGVLVEQSHSARMVVIGSRGLGAVSSSVLGSTVSHVASHAYCPVVVVQSGGVADGPVIVGVDGSAESEETVGWAFDHASRHGLPLEVLHAYAIPVYPGVVPYVPPVEITKATSDFEHRVTQEVLAGWGEKFPDVPVTATVVHGRPAPALIDASGRASLTVVGSHGRGSFLGMLLGSTSQSLLHHARGSVVVLRHRRH
jgi:nucleotide-binding universal stress UspA family protein